MNTKVEDLERLHNLHVAGAITEIEFKILKKEIIGELSAEIDDDVYKSVKIGEQEWMVENLNVEHFRNGDIIPEAKTKEEWVKAWKENRPAWCYYDNNPSNGEKYGKLYNWYAVSDPRGFPPEGWHVPTDAEWTNLTDYLSADGHSGEEGTALKAASGWEVYGYASGHGTDDYGWLGHSGGGRSGNGVFGSNGYWWSSSQSKTNDAWYRLLDCFNDNVDRYDGNKVSGFSVRCLKD